MALDTSKCGKKTVHLQAKDTGKHYVRLMTCNKLECPSCQPVISARIKKKIHYYKALAWYEKKKKKLIASDLDIELQIMARMDA
ncbi:ATP-dependent DNA helicase, partial [Bacillus cytotoxicus]